MRALVPAKRIKVLMSNLSLIGKSVVNETKMIVFEHYVVAVLSQL